MRSLRPIVKPVYLADGGYDERVVGYELTPDTTPGQARRISAELQRMLEPGDPGAIATELARLKALTKARSQEGVATAYLDELLRYPGWAVKEACRKLSSTSVFFPAWAEMREALEALVTPYRATSGQMKRAAPPEEPAPRYNELTPEQRAEFDRTMKDYYREMGRPA